MKEVTAAIIINDNKALITRRGRGQKMQGYWEFPGGKVEKGETAQQCLERELQEELGLTIKAADIIYESEYIYEHGAFRILAINSEIIKGSIQLRVHDKFEWVPTDKLSEYMLLPADVPIAEYLLTSCI